MTIFTYSRKKKLSILTLCYNTQKHLVSNEKEQTKPFSKDLQSYFHPNCELYSTILKGN